MKGSNIFGREEERVTGGVEGLQQYCSMYVCRLSWWSLAQSVAGGLSEKVRRRVWNRIRRVNRGGNLPIWETVKSRCRAPGYLLTWDRVSHATM